MTAADGPTPNDRRESSSRAGGNEDLLRIALESLLHGRARGADAEAGEPLTAARSDVGRRGTGAQRERLDERIADRVTGLYAPGIWLEMLPDAQARWKRYGRPFVLVQVEVAGIAQIALRLGTETADRLLGMLAAVLREETRASDQYARLPQWRIQGLLPETDPTTVVPYIERVRAAFERRLGPGIPIRLLVGTAGPETEGDLGGVMLAAEQAMFQDGRPAG